ncbi:MAG: hypothetical protein ACPL25_07990, partial [Ignavibacteria bacterium]
MIKRLISLVILFLISSSSFAQDKIYFAGVSGSYLIPTGSLSYRFKPDGGFTLFAGYKQSESWEWFGKFEYISFMKENRDQLKIKRNVNLGGVEEILIFDLQRLETDLKIFGVSANANASILDFDFLRSDLSFGFGIYRWESERSGYFDTLRVERSGITYDAVILKVPPLKQLDWSGGFNIGLSVSTKIINPI